MSEDDTESEEQIIMFSTYNPFRQNVYRLEEKYVNDATLTSVNELPKIS
jgi:hypothetical protein